VLVPGEIWDTSTGTSDTSGDNLWRAMVKAIYAWGREQPTASRSVHAVLHIKSYYGPVVLYKSACCTAHSKKNDDQSSALFITICASYYVSFCGLICTTEYSREHATSQDDAMQMQLYRISYSVFIIHILAGKSVSITSHTHTHSLTYPMSIPHTISKSYIHIYT
jgi:hypothetical protein